MVWIFVGPHDVADSGGVAVLDGRRSQAANVAISWSSEVLVSAASRRSTFASRDFRISAVVHLLDKIGSSARAASTEINESIG